MFQLSLTSSSRNQQHYPSANDYVLPLGKAQYQRVHAVRLGSLEMQQTMLTVDDEAGNDTVVFDDGLVQCVGPSTTRNVVLRNGSAIDVCAHQLVVEEHDGTSSAYATVSVPPHLLAVTASNGDGTLFTTMADHGVATYQTWRATRADPPRDVAVVAAGTHKALAVAAGDADDVVAVHPTDPDDAADVVGAFLHAPALHNEELASYLTHALAGSALQRRYRVTYAADTGQYRVAAVGGGSAGLTSVLHGGSYAGSVLARLGGGSSARVPFLSADGVGWRHSRSSTVTPGMYDPAGLATAMDTHLNGVRGLGGHRFTSSATVSWQVNTTLGFLDTAGAEKTIGIGGGAYTAQQLAAGIAFRMGECDTNGATYECTYANGRYTLRTSLTSSGTPFALLFSGQYSGASNAGALTNLLGFHQRDYHGESSYTSSRACPEASPPVTPWAGLSADGAGDAVFPSAPGTVDDVSLFDTGGILPTRKRYVMRTFAPEHVGSTTIDGSFLITAGDSAGEVVVESRAALRISMAADAEVSTTAPLGISVGQVVRLRRAADDRIVTGVVLEELETTGDTGPNGGGSLDVDADKRATPTSDIRDGTRYRVLVHTNVSGAVAAGGEPLGYLSGAFAPRLQLHAAPSTIRDRLGLSRDCAGRASHTMPRQWNVDHPQYILVVLHDQHSATSSHVQPDDRTGGVILGKLVMGGGYTLVREQQMTVTFSSYQTLSDLHVSLRLPDGSLYPVHGTEHTWTLWVVTEPADERHVVPTSTLRMY